MQIKRLKLSGFKSFVEPAELRDRAGPDRRRRPQWLRQVERARGDTLGDGRILAQVDARRRHGRRHLRRHRRRGRRAISPKSRCSSSARPRTCPATSTLAPVGDVEITRRIERGAGSAYRVNGRDVRAQDVALLFADAATGAHSPALVSQGRISAVIAAKPTERRLMLEEAAGHFRPPRPPQGCRAEAARDRGQSHPARRGDRRHGGARRGAAPPGQGRRTLSPPLRPDPDRRRRG